jgi:transposase-like protein
MGLVAERKVFSDELKASIVRDIESGRHSISEAARICGAGNTTVRDWVNIYGKFKKRRIVEVVMSDQTDKIEELQKAVADMHLKLRIYEKIIETADNFYKTDLKKSFGTKASESLEEKNKASK